MSDTSVSDASAPLLLEVGGLVVSYSAGRRRTVRAVNGISLTIGVGETVGLVGESGSGKSSVGNAVLGLAPVSAGSIRFDGVDISAAGRLTRRGLADRLQVIFQDPYGSLNPTRRIGLTIAEGLRVRTDLSHEQVQERVRQILPRVGLSAADADRYPGRFSGGQRQRIAIARALVVGPKLVICDEPVSSLDLSVQAQVLNLLRELQGSIGCSYLFISHDLAAVRYVSHRILVLYRGKLVEEGDAESIYRASAHPYTRALVNDAPVADPTIQRLRRRASSREARSDSSVPITGCPYAPRCQYATDICRTVDPPLQETPLTTVACHHWREVNSVRTTGNRNSIIERKR